MKRITPFAIERGSYYGVQAGQDPVYGAWPDQCILGLRCTIRAEEMPSGDLRAMDALRVPGSFRRGGMAMHVSGRDKFGGHTGPGFIRALAMYSIDWGGANDIPSGLGCEEPEPAGIVSWDGSDGRGHLDDRWKIHAHYGGCSYFWTLEGIHAVFAACHRFDVADIIRHSNSAWRRDRVMAYDDTQKRSCRRLLESSIGVNNHQIPGQPVLERVGRWDYRWRT